ncbi:hypothetical protein DPMN_048662 [Dreissena polymorpha]|uniref:Uncharacterized protein n=1 Tax=Dreissena polymorpha TaxID=45954 RepID=A0A9D4DB38_DREPO|nr:hypothetical protein DPMN_048662 [Dreissena polymorpha]
MRSDLLTIRFASLNQILDPWVYILVRREIVSRLIITIRKIISPKATEVQIRTFLRQDSAHSAKDSTYTCCTFCFHCLCDPSQQRRADSVSGNHGSNYIAFPMSPRLPTNKHAIGVIRNVMLPNTSIDSPAVLVRRSQVIAGLKRQASVEVINNQPNNPCVSFMKPFDASCDDAENRLSDSDNILNDRLLSNITE